MQNFFKPVLKVCLAIIAITLMACQSEEPFEADINPVITLTATSPIVEIMSRTTANDGSYDNIVDGASCVGIQFPYDVIVNKTPLTISSIEDFDNIENILDTVDSDESLNSSNSFQQNVSEIVIIFPVTITLADQTEVVVESEADLESHTRQCLEGGDDIDIECVDLVYPISLFTYSPEFQQTGIVMVDHDKEMQRFLAGLVETDLISIEFPLTFRLHDSTEVTVNSNTALADAMQRAVDTCDEDDDNDYNDDDFTKEGLDGFLMSCPWSVRKSPEANLESFERTPENILTFSEDGTVLSGNGFSPAQLGEWSVGVSDFKIFVRMSFDDAPELNGNRYTYDIGEGLIKMDGSEHGEIIIEQTCEFTNQTCDRNFIEKTLQNECRWTVFQQQNDEVQSMPSIEFAENRIDIYDMNGTVVDQGAYFISGSVITFSGLDKAYLRIVGDWKIIACSDQRFSLQRGDEIMAIESNCKF